MLGAFANAFRTPDLRRKLLFVLLIITIFRLGSQIPTPGVDVANVKACIDVANSGDNASLYSLVNLFSGIGQAFAVLSKGFDDHAINARVDDTTTGARRFGRLIAAGHSGQIQTYLGAIAIGMLLLLVLYAWLV